MAMICVTLMCTVHLNPKELGSVTGKAMFGKRSTKVTRGMRFEVNLGKFSVS